MFVLLAVLLLPVNAFASGGSIVNNISPVLGIDSDHQASPAISADGSTVVWLNTRDGNGNIYGKNLNTGQEFQVSTNIGEDQHPSISGDGNIVAWDNSYNGNLTVKVKNLSTDEITKFSTSSANDGSFPFISDDGETVIYRNAYNGTTYLRSVNMYNGSFNGLSSVFYEGAVTPNYISVSANGNRVIWEGNRQLEMKDKYSDAVTRVASHIVEPDISGDGNIAVWTSLDDYNIYGENVQTNEMFRVSNIGGSKGNAAVSADGSVVVWEDRRNGNYDIYGKHLETGEEFQVTSESSGQFNPSISADGTVVVWQDLRNGNWDVYKADLDLSAISTDINPPEITLNGNSDITINVGQNYTDQGATAIDNMDGDLTADIVVDNSINTAIVGKYVITYTVSDRAGNQATATRTVHVVDTTAPKITLNGDSEVTLEVEEPYTDLGATAQDNLDGNLTNSIAVNNPVDTSMTGSYTITYNVSDNNGNVANQVARIVHVVDTTVPQITLNGNSEVTLEVGSSYSDLGAQAIDNYDGDISNQIVISNPVNASNVGDYVIRYNVIDSCGNSANEVTRTVHVIGSIDSAKPVITVTGDTEITVEVNTEYSDMGASSTDDTDGDLFANIITDNPVDMAVLGDYTVIYTVTDSAGNQSTASRIVHVVDTTPPVITLNGDAQMDLAIGANYQDPGAVASDSYDGDLTDSIIVNNLVDTSIPGNYTVTYTVSDNTGNTASETRTVIVEEPTPILQQLTVTPNPIDLEVGNSVTLTVMAFMSDGSSNDVTTAAAYTVQDNSIVSISNNTITGLNPGPTTLNVSYQGKECVVSINITAGQDNNDTGDPNDGPIVNRPPDRTGNTGDSNPIVTTPRSRDNNSGSNDPVVSLPNDRNSNTDGSDNTTVTEPPSRNNDSSGDSTVVTQPSDRGESTTDGTSGDRVVNSPDRTTDLPSNTQVTSPENRQNGSLSGIPVTRPSR